MARLSVTCRCGWVFFVRDEEQKKGSARCPSCGQNVDLKAASEATLKKEVGPEGAGKTKIYVAIAGLSAIAVLLAFLILRSFMTDGTPPPPPQKQQDPVPPITDDGEEKKRIAEEERRKTEALQQVEKEIGALLERGDKAVSVQDWYAALVAYADARKLMPAGDSRIAVLEKKIQRARAEDQKKRDEEERKKREWEEANKKHPIPPELAAKIEERVLSLPKFYFDLVITLEDAERVRELLKAKEAKRDDLSFLESVADSKKADGVRAEMTTIRDSAAKLQEEATEGLPKDRLLMKDGRTLDGEIVEVGTEVVKIKRKVGTGEATMPFQLADVQEVQKGKGVGTEFLTRFETAKKGGIAEALELMKWCKENALATQATMAAWMVLLIDPSHEGARTEVKLPRAPVVKSDEPVGSVKDGMITFEGQSYEPKALKTALLKRGRYFLIGGHWYGKSDKAVTPTIKNLYVDPPKDIDVRLRGAELGKEIEVEENWKDDPVHMNYKIESKIEESQRFYAPPLSTAEDPIYSYSSSTSSKDSIKIVDKGVPEEGSSTSGEISIAIAPIETPILEGWVEIHSQVGDGGAISVSVAADGGRRAEMYKLTGRTKDTTQHPLPNLVQGSHKLEFFVSMTMPAAYSKKQFKYNMAARIDNGKVMHRGLDYIHDRLIPEYRTMLFPCKKMTTYVFRLNLTVGTPLPALDKLFKDAKAESLLKTP